MEQKRIALTVSLPPRLARKFEKLARAESKNKIQLFREMIYTYEQRRLEEEFFDLQRYGSRQAKKKGLLTEADIDALVFKGRRL